MVIGRLGANGAGFGGIAGIAAMPVDGARGPTEGNRPELGAPGGIEFGFVGSGM